MSLISAKCPNCGATLQLDNERKSSFCSYCGSKLRIQGSNNLIKIDKSEEIKNLLNLAEDAIQEENLTEAYDYINRALELDSSNIDAYIAKMKVLSPLCSDTYYPEDFCRIKTLIVAGNKVIKLSAGSQRNLVYTIYLNDNIKKIIEIMLQESDIQHWRMNEVEEDEEEDNEVYEEDEELWYEQKIILKLIREIPVKAVLQEQTLITEIKNIANLWMKFVNEELTNQKLIQAELKESAESTCVLYHNSTHANKTYKIWSPSYLRQSIAEAKKIVECLKERLPQSIAENINEQWIEFENRIKAEEIEYKKKKQQVDKELAYKKAEEDKKRREAEEEARRVKEEAQKAKEKKERSNRIAWIVLGIILILELIISLMSDSTI